jgi:PPOX class probable F420-dependent enzyme
MGYTSMTEPDWRAFLASSPARPALLATTRKDGRPHVAPIWYDTDDDGTIVFNTGAETLKGRSIRRTGQVALCVQDDEAPFSFVSIEGTAEVVDDLDEEYGARNGVPGELLVRVTPTNVVAKKDVAD